MTRRELLGGIVKGCMIASLIDAPSVFEGGMAMAAETEKKNVQSPTAYSGMNQIKPLRFDPTKLQGLSEKFIVSHH